MAKDKKDVESNSDTATKKPKKQHTVRDILLIVLGVMIVIGLAGSMMGYGATGTDTAVGTTTEEEPVDENAELYQSYADQAHNYFNEIYDTVDQAGSIPSEELVNKLNDLSTRITQTKNEIPEDTTDETLKTEREMFDVLGELSLLPTTAAMTHASEDEISLQNTKLKDEYNDLARKILKYYPLEWIES